ncbi:hypothetical protein [Cribrihabitans marinus]|nr:hypothetical protein [Cribrihabitans marinus]GGH25351.1 hypothetical protein GCM10010973_12440 [Cribrihabitans marinus]
MKTLAWIPVAALVLTGCAPLSIYHKPGVQVSRLEADTTRCEVAALKDVPVNTQIRQGAPIYRPGGRYCRDGRCWTGPGYWDSGPVYTVDANRGLRDRATELCMAEKGYRPVSLPPCSQGIRSQVPLGRMTTLPRLTPASCFLRNEDGSYRIISPVTAPIASQGG